MEISEALKSRTEEWAAVTSRGRTGEADDAVVVDKEASEAWGDDGWEDDGWEASEA